MKEIQQKNDWLTVAAIGLLAMCVVTFDHEALGHGGACLTLHGRILILSSSVFRCDINSGLIDAAGPLANILCGALALGLRLLVPTSARKLRLFLALVTAFSFFWESGYLAQAALAKHGDLYFFAQWAFGSIGDWQRWTAAAVGIALYVLSIRVTTRALLGIIPDPNNANVVARTVWSSAAMGAAIAAMTYTGSVPGGFRDAVMEIGLASVPLLFIPGTERIKPETPSTTIGRDVFLVVVALVIYCVFVMTLGRGVS